MSRTDELRGGGAEQVAGGGGSDHPWFRWPDNHANVEGVLLETFTTKYGLVGVMKLVSWEPSGLEASAGRDEPNVRLEQGMKVNVPLYYKALEGVTQNRLGHRLHVAFTGWEMNEAGTKYRKFEAFDLGAVEGFETEESPQTESDPETQPAGGGPGLQDDGPPPREDDLPF